MSQNKILTNEIIRHIITSFGVINSLSLSSANDNMLSSNQFLTKKLVRIRYDDNIDVDHQVNAAQISYGENSKFKALLVDLSLSDEEIEFCCVFQADKMPLHGLRLRYDSEDTGMFKVYNSSTKTWIDAPIAVQALVLNGVENIVSYGLLWESLENFSELYDAANYLISL